MHLGSGTHRGACGESPSPQAQLLSFSHWNPQPHVQHGIYPGHLWPDPQSNEEPVWEWRWLQSLLLGFRGLDVGTLPGPAVVELVATVTITPSAVVAAVPRNLTLALPPPWVLGALGILRAL